MHSSNGQSSARSSEITFALSIAVAIVWGYVIVVFFPRQPILGGDFMVFYIRRLHAPAAGLFTIGRRSTKNFKLRSCPVRRIISTALPIPPLAPVLYLPFAWNSFVTAFAVSAATMAAVHAVDE